MSDPGSTYRTRDEISGVRQVYYYDHDYMSYYFNCIEEFTLSLFYLLLSFDYRSVIQLKE